MCVGRIFVVSFTQRKENCSRNWSGWKSCRRSGLERENGMKQGKEADKMCKKEWQVGCGHVFPNGTVDKGPTNTTGCFFFCCFFACFLSSIFSLIWSPVNSNPSSSSRHHTTATNQGGRRVLCASAKTRDAECIFSNWRSWKISIYLLSHTWGNRCSWLASIEGDYSIPPLAPAHGWLWHC